MYSSSSANAETSRFFGNNKDSITTFNPPSSTSYPNSSPSSSSSAPPNSSSNMNNYSTSRRQSYSYNSQYVNPITNSNPLTSRTTLSNVSEGYPSSNFSKSSISSYSTSNNNNNSNYNTSTATNNITSNGSINNSDIFTPDTNDNTPINSFNAASVKSQNSFKPSLTHQHSLPTLSNNYLNKALNNLTIQDFNQEIFSNNTKSYLNNTNLNSRTTITPPNTRSSPPDTSFSSSSSNNSSLTTASLKKNEDLRIQLGIVNNINRDLHSNYLKSQSLVHLNQMDLFKDEELGINNSLIYLYDVLALSLQSTSKELLETKGRLEALYTAVYANPLKDYTKFSNQDEQDTAYKFIDNLEKLIITNNKLKNSLDYSKAKEKDVKLGWLINENKKLKKDIKSFQDSIKDVI